MQTSCAVIVCRMIATLSDDICTIDGRIQRSHCCRLSLSIFCLVRQSSFTIKSLPCDIRKAVIARLMKNMMTKMMYPIVVKILYAVESKATASSE